MLKFSGLNFFKLKLNFSRVASTETQNVNQFSLKQMGS